MAVALGLIGLYFQLARPAVGAPAHGVEHCEGTGEGSYRVLELEGRNASLVLFGARHRTDPADPITGRINVGFTKGAALADWLQNARGNTGTLGDFDISGSRHSVTAVNPTYAQDSRRRQPP